MDETAKKTGVFVNFTNHPSSMWEEAQTRAALAYGAPILDLPFPKVDPMADETDLQILAEEKAAEILSLHPAAVLCQGEFGLCFSVIRRLQAAGVRVLHACSERNVHEEGSVKTVRFDFVKFRAYEGESRN